MPYRRLPNTDQARIRALKAIVDKNDGFKVNELPVSFKTLADARNFLAKFDTAQRYYKQCLDNQVKSNKKYQSQLKMARLYISHFIQVLNLAVIRSEIKEDYKKFYGLEPTCYTVPDLTNEPSICEWGEKIIKGEKERLRKGGIPIYNPTIAKVNVHYDIFKESYELQKGLQSITNRSLEDLSSMRAQADEIILDIWNQVEKFFETLPADEKMKKCQEYGIIYYYRTSEKKKLSL